MTPVDVEWTNLEYRVPQSLLHRDSLRRIHNEESGDQVLGLVGDRVPFGARKTIPEINKDKIINYDSLDLFVVCLPGLHDLPYHDELLPVPKWRTSD